MNEPTDLISLYKTLVPGVTKVYVFPRIEKASICNPYLRLLYKPVIERSSIAVVSTHPLLPLFLLRKLFGEKSIIHYHWLECSDVKGILVVLWKLVWVIAYRACLGTVVWTIHNAQPHSKKYQHLHQVLYGIMSGISHALHVHSTYAVESMAPTLHVSTSKFVVLPIPHYDAITLPPAEAYDHLIRTYGFCLTPSKPLFLMFGYVSAYKGILEVIEIFSSHKQCQLIIAGDVKPIDAPYVKKLQNAAVNQTHIHLHTSFVNHLDVPFFFNAADYVLFNFLQILSSSSIVLARSYKKKIIIPALPSLTEFHGPDAYTFDNKEQLHTIITNLEQAFNRKTS